MPTFVFFQSGKEVDRLKGANKEPIEQTIKKYNKVTPTKDAGYVGDRYFSSDISMMVSFFYRQI
jgi:thioredoxin-like negative regulator of GroEL